MTRALPGHTVNTAQAKGWDTLSNGALLKAAEEAGFDVPLTTDRRLRYQQNLTARGIALVVFTGSTKWSGVRQHTFRIAAAVGAAAPGSFVEVEIPFPRANGEDTPHTGDNMRDSWHRRDVLRVLGSMSIPHTWGQTLVRHPHVHCVVPAGGLSPDHQRWIHPKYAGFFLPVKVLSRVFRGKFVAALRRAYDRNELDLLESPDVVEIR